MFSRSRRYKHLTDTAPCRTAVRTQSIAVSPPPITTIRLPFAFSVPSSYSGTVSPRPTRLDAVNYVISGKMLPSPTPGTWMSRAW